MRKSDHAFRIGVMVILLAFVGCVDIDTTNVPLKDYRSLVRFVNLAAGLGTATITVDKEAFGDLPFGEASGYKNIPAGSRKLLVSFSAVRDTLDKVFLTDKKETVFVTVDTFATVATAERDYVLADERYVFQAAGIKDTALVRVFHASPDAGAITVVATGGLEIAKGLAFKKGTSYVKLPPGNYSFTVTSGTETLSEISHQFAANKRYTVAIYDLKASIKQKLFEDD